MFTIESIPLLLLVHPLQYFPMFPFLPSARPSSNANSLPCISTDYISISGVIGKGRNLSYSLVPGLLTPSQSNPHRRCDITSKFKIETKFSHALPAVSSSQTSVCVYYLQKLVYEVSMKSETIFLHF